MASAKETTAAIYDELRTNEHLRVRVGFESAAPVKAGPRRNSDTVLAFVNRDGQTVTITTTVA